MAYPHLPFRENNNSCEAAVYSLVIYSKLPIGRFEFVIFSKIDKKTDVPIVLSIKGYHACKWILAKVDSIAKNLNFFGKEKIPEKHRFQHDAFLPKTIDLEKIQDCVKMFFRIKTSRTE